MVEVRARHYYGRLARLNRWVIKRGAHVYVSLWVRKLDTTEHADTRSRPRPSMA